MAGLTMPATWINCTPDQIKVGMEARVIETHTDDDSKPVATVTIEGTVTRVDHNYIWFGPCVSTSQDRENLRSQWYRLPKKLPLDVGSAIKVYDPHNLRERVAVRQVRPDAETTRETGWYFVDEAPDGFRITQAGREVPDLLLEKAEILFDASKA